MSSLVNWIQNNWVPLLIGIGIGGVIGAVIKAITDPPQLSLTQLVPQQYEELATEYIHKWEKAGVPQKTIELALKWARDWANNLANKLIPNPELASKVSEVLYPEALGFAEKYIEAMTGIQLGEQGTQGTQGAGT